MRMGAEGDQGCPVAELLFVEESGGAEGATGVATTFGLVAFFRSSTSRRLLRASITFRFSCSAFSNASVACFNCRFNASVSFVSWAMRRIPLRQRAEDHPIKHLNFILSSLSARATGAAQKLILERISSR